MPAADRLKPPGFWTLTPLGRRRLALFRANRRGFWSLRIFGLLCLLCLLAEVLANDRPLMLRYEGELMFPVVQDIPETRFGGFLETPAVYRDPFVRDEILAKGWILWAPIRFAANTVNDEAERFPAPPSAQNWLGTDDQGRDVVARLLYGLRLSILFALVLTGLSSVIGIAAGAVQGFYGGWVDLILQRFIEIWSSMPALYLLMIMASFFAPGFWSLLWLLLLFSWMGLVGVVRAEFLRARNFDYVRAARALGASDWTLMRRHILPNAMVATLSFLPFTISSGITTLTALDFLGLGLPPGTPSMGELLLQGKNNLTAPWLGLTAFLSLAILLSLLTFIGEALRDAFDPRKSLALTSPAPAESAV